MLNSQSITGEGVLQYNESIIGSKHYRKENAGSRHLHKEGNKAKTLKTIIAIELVSVVLCCFAIYDMWQKGVELRNYMEAFNDMHSHTIAITDSILTSNLESIDDEVNEYVWTTGKIEYREGADKTYAAAGSLDEDKMVKRTGITYSGWSRVNVDDKEYYVPPNALSADIPDNLPIASGAKGEYQKYALSLLPDYGWESSELVPLINLWNRESGWNPRSHNKSSGAHGIPQALPASKMASEGSDYYTNPEPQIRWGLGYIAHRYGSPSAAWAHFCSRGWY